MMNFLKDNTTQITVLNLLLTETGYQRIEINGAGIVKLIEKYGIELAEEQGEPVTFREASQGFIKELLTDLDAAFEGSIQTKLFGDE